MSPFDPKKPPAPYTFTTGAGVTVIVNPPPPPEATQEPRQAREPGVPAPPSPCSTTPSAPGAPSEPSEPGEPSEPSAVDPPARSLDRRGPEGERDAFIRMLEKEYGSFIQVVCCAQGGATPESAKDLALGVLVTAAAQFDKLVRGPRWPPQNLRGWLAKLALYEASNHRRARERRREVGLDDDEAFFSPAPDPEGTAELNQKRARLSRYLDSIPQVEAEVFICSDLYEMTIEQTAEAVGRSPGTVATQLRRAKGRLEELARESDRATAAGERRR